MKQAIISLMESEEMKVHIEKEYARLRPWQLIYIIDCARCGIEHKLDLLRQLKNAPEMSKEDAEKTDLQNMISDYEQAVSHMSCPNRGDVFLVGEKSFDSDCRGESTDGFSPYTSFYKAMAFIRDTWEEIQADGGIDGECTFWYTIEKWSPDYQGDMHEMIEYFVSADGEVWDFYTRKHSPGEVNIPHPFTEGDIVLMDATPVFPSRVGLILDMGQYPNDCCSPQCLYMNIDGRFDIGALKHKSVFSDYSHHILALSPMYRLKQYTGQLSEREKILKLIGDEIKKQQGQGKVGLGSVIWEQIFQMDKKGKGVTRKQLKTIFEESKQICLQQ